MWGRWQAFDFILVGPLVGGRGYEMKHLGLGGGGEAWKWHRRLWAWEEEQLEECSALSNYVVLQDDVNDMWLWSLHTSKKIYSWRCLQFFTIMYHVLHNCLSTKDNLFKRAVILAIVSLAWEVVVIWRMRLI